jgi:hypothetical protein
MALRDGQWEVRARVARSLLGVTGTGKQQLAVTFEYLDENNEKRFVTAYQFFTDAALPWTVEALRALGWDPEANNWDILTLDGTDVLKGREVALVLEEEEYEGKRRTKVRFINALGGAGVERLAPDQAKSFASDLRRRLMQAAPPKAGGAKGGAAKKPAPSPSPAPKAAAGQGASAPGKDSSPDLNLDDIPF